MTCRPSNATSNGSQDKSPNGPVNGRSPDEAPPNRHCLWPSYIVSWALWDVRYSCRRGGERVAFHCGTYEKRANECKGLPRPEAAPLCQDWFAISIFSRREVP